MSLLESADEYRLYLPYGASYLVAIPVIKNIKLPTTNTWWYGFYQGWTWRSQGRLRSFLIGNLLRPDLVAIDNCINPGGKVVITTNGPRQPYGMQDLVRCRINITSANTSASCNNSNICLFQLNTIVFWYYRTWMATSLHRFSMGLLRPVDVLRKFPIKQHIECLSWLQFKSWHRSSWPVSCNVKYVPVSTWWNITVRTFFAVWCLTFLPQH